MKKLVIWAYHGSPGTILDFNPIKKNLSENYEICVLDRYNNSKNIKFQKPDIILAYSYGCAVFLSQLENLDISNIKKVVLVSPYLFSITPISNITKTILNIPIFSELLLKKIGPKKIKDFLIKSSHPNTPSEEYLKLENLLTDPKILKHSTLEKSDHSEDILNSLKILNEKNITVEVIYGEKDLTSLYDVQISPLLKYQNIKIQTIKDSGHALLWSSPKDITKALESIISNGENMSDKFGYFKGANQLNNVAAFMSDHLKKFPDRKILTWVHPEEIKKWSKEGQAPIPHQSITVKELDYLVGVLATEFKNLGILKNDRVILFLPMSLYMYASMFALQKIGAIPTFLDSWARRDQMGVSAKVAAPKAMISGHRAFDYLKDVIEIEQIPIKIVAGEIPPDSKYTARLELLLKGTQYAPITEVESEHTALITFTTGSSGTPKGADRSHRFLAAQHYALNRHLPYNENDIDLPVFPIFSLNNLAAGVETVIPAIDVGMPQATDAMILYYQMKSSGVTCTTLSPSLFNGLSDYCIKNNLNLDFLKRIVTGGAPISRGDVEKMKSVAHQADILVLYGSTEVEPMAHIEAREWLSLKASEDLELEDPGVNVGHLDEGLKYKFIKINKDPVYVESNQDWIEQTVPQGEVGELIVAGEHVCEKYFNNEDAFFRAKIKDHENIVWHRTGDLGFIDLKNHLWIVGRVHNAINRDQKWYFPVRAEIVMKKIAYVDKAAYLGIPDEKLGQKTCAVITLKENVDSNTAKNEIQRLLSKNQFITDYIEIVAEIPMDPRHHSKVEYDILRKKLKEIL